MNFEWLTTNSMKKYWILVRIYYGRKNKSEKYRYTSIIELITPNNTHLGIVRY